MVRTEFLVGRELAAIPTPALLLDLDVLDANLELMASALRAKSCNIRPHMKSHKCIPIAALQVKKGAVGISCATVAEAEVLAHAGIQNILVANEVVEEAKLRLLAGLARYSEIAVLVDAKDNCSQISRIAEAAGAELGVLVDVDVRLRRCGVRSPEAAVALARHITQLRHVRFLGLSAYEGGHGLNGDIVRTCMEKAVDTRDRLVNAGMRVEVVSGGSTGTWDLTSSYPGVTEIQAGSYALMETGYKREGVPFQIAISVLATVVSRSKDRIVLDAGEKAITKGLGLPILKHFPDVPTELHEEHCLLEVSSEVRNLRVGDKVELLPSHCPTTVNLHSYYHCVRSGVVEAIWGIEGPGRVR